LIHIFIESPPGYCGALRSICHIGRNQRVDKHRITATILIFPGSVSFFILSKIKMVMQILSALPFG